jgi:hypothetical protein
MHAVPICVSCASAATLPIQRFWPDPAPSWAPFRSHQYETTSTADAVRIARETAQNDPPGPGKLLKAIHRELLHGAEQADDRAEGN